MQKAKWAAATAIVYCSCLNGAFAGQESGKVEDIYVLRSLRLSRIAATDFCASTKTGFLNMDSEDQFLFQSVNTDTADGRITDANVATVGTLHACFGPTSDLSHFSFYAEGGLSEFRFTGRGECLMAHQDFPEQGLNVLRCYLDLYGLPASFVGGQLTTNTVTSRRTVGASSDPPGYVQPSIATLHLWKKRGGN